jgi:hypothetical protein
MRQKFWLAIFVVLIFVSILGTRPGHGNVLVSFRR